VDQAEIEKRDSHMTDINWTKIDHFHPDDFSEDPNKDALPKLIYNVDQWRKLCGFPISPSLAEGALARFGDADKDSRHYAVERKSDALDCFPHGDPVQAFMAALCSQLFGAVGLYLDTMFRGHPWPMLHVDLRPLGEGHSKEMALIWVRDEGEYVYPQYEANSTGLISDLDEARVLYKRVSSNA
jgi:hypothetical protein